MARAIECGEEEEIKITVSETKNNNGDLSWASIAIALVLLVILTKLSDIILVCYLYGYKAYFQDGLHVAHHKPLTLSSGEVISGNVSFLAFLFTAGFWLVSFFLCRLIFSKIINWRKKVENEVTEK